MKWTKNEMSLLKRFYRIEDRDILIKLLNGRSWVSIKEQARALKLNRYFTPKERFLQQVNQNGNDQGCWHWTGTLSHNGYGRFTVNDKKVGAHRFAWQLYFGKIPKTKFILHTCSNRKCVNPGHLMLGTRADTMRHMKEKNRQAKGETHPQAKLNEAEVRVILRLTDELFPKEIAKMFNVSPKTISHILCGDTWKDIQ